MEKLKSRLKELVESLDYYLYDITYEKEGNDYILRVMIENDTFINIDDCIKVSKFVSEELDVLDPFKDPYMFEVTSAGAEHELRNSDEIKRAVGQNVHLETPEQKMDGKLEKFNDGILTIKQKNKRIHEVNYIDVSFIRTAIVL